MYINIGDLIILGSGSSVPADCVINEGKFEVDQAALTGECYIYILLRYIYTVLYTLLCEFYARCFLYNTHCIHHYTHYHTHYITHIYTIISNRRISAQDNA